METPTVIIESLFERVESYGITAIKLSKLKIIQTTTTVTTVVLTRLIVFFIFFLFFFLINIGIALFIGDLLGRSYYGFFIVGTFYFVCGIILYFFLYNWIRKPLSNFIISQSLQ